MTSVVLPRNALGGAGSEKGEAFAAKQSGKHSHLHTKSIEQVLLPISEQVSQLIILDEQTRVSGSPMPDLTAAAEAIGMATRNLVAVGREAMAAGDEQLRAQMPAACEQVQAAGKLFMDATFGLRADPRSAQSRTMLIDAARGLLSGTTNVLTTYDAFDVRKIVGLGELVIERLAAAKEVQSLEDIVAAIKAVTSSLVAFAQLADARQEELLNANHRMRLGIANEQLRKASPLLVPALKTFVQNPSNVQAQASRNFAIEQLLNCTADIIHIVGSSDLDDGHFEEVPGHLAVLFDTTQAMLLSAAPVQRETLTTNTAQIVAESTVIAGKSTSVERADDVRALCGSVSALAGQFVPSADKQTIETAAEALRTDLNRLEQRVRDCAVAEISAALIDAQPPAPIDDVLEQATSGDQAAVAGAVTVFTAHTERLISAARQASSLSLDAKRVKMIEVTSDQMRMCAQMVSTAALVLVASPYDRAAQEQMAVAKNTWTHRAEMLRATIASITNPDKVVTLIGESVLRQANDANIAVRGNRAALAQARKSITDHVQHILHTATSEVENSEDASYRQPLQRAIDALRRTTPLYLEHLGALSENQSTLNERTIELDVAEMSSAIRTLNAAIRGPQVPPTITEMSFSDDEDDTPPTGAASPTRASVTASAPATPAAAAAVSTPPTPHGATPAAVLPAGPIVPAVAPSGPIATAAQVLRRETSRYSVKHNPVVAAARQMAEQMTVLASYQESGTGNKSQMIASARAIADQGRDIVNVARQIAEACTDKRLKADLLYLCERVPSISTQLKIISSVKAAATGDSDDADAMLVKNAQNLMDAVQRTVRACEAASIKTVDTAAVPSDIRWRKKGPRTSMVVA
eukprot:m.5458 g.5458  ORF g.5458 m.5458 type:complete len:866 (-) comp4536_c0_seq1:83-2680(-)